MSLNSGSGSMNWTSICSNSESGSMVGNSVDFAYMGFVAVGIDVMGLGFSSVGCVGFSTWE